MAKHQSYPKMVYKNVSKKVVQFHDEVGFEHKIVHSEEEHKKLGSEWGDHPGLKLNAEPEESAAEVSEDDGELDKKPKLKVKSK